MSKVAAMFSAEGRDLNMHELPSRGAKRLRFSIALTGVMNGETESAGIPPVGGCVPISPGFRPLASHPRPGTREGSSFLLSSETRSLGQWIAREWIPF